LKRKHASAYDVLQALMKSGNTVISLMMFYDLLQILVNLLGCAVIATLGRDSDAPCVATRA
jgi:hypothetical protein